MRYLLPYLDRILRLLSQYNKYNRRVTWNVAVTFIVLDGLNYKVQVRVFGNEEDIEFIKAYLRNMYVKEMGKNCLLAIGTCYCLYTIA